jgi:hypothetical protein
MSDYTDNNHLVKWVIEGSDDRNEWMCLDERETHELNGNGRVSSFKIENDSEIPFFRYVRLRQNGRNSSNNDHLVLNRIEFFGRRLYERGFE